MINLHLLIIALREIQPAVVQQVCSSYFVSERYYLRSHGVEELLVQRISRSFRAIIYTTKYDLVDEVRFLQQHLQICWITTDVRP